MPRLRTSVDAVAQRQYTTRRCESIVPLAQRTSALRWSSRSCQRQGEHLYPCHVIGQFYTAPLSLSRPTPEVQVVLFDDDFSCLQVTLAESTLWQWQDLERQPASSRSSRSLLKSLKSVAATSQRSAALERTSKDY